MKRLPADLVSTWLMGCEVIPDSGMAMVGCANGRDSRKLYSWDMSGTDFTEVADCSHSQGQFSVKDSSTIFINGSNRRFWTFDETNGYNRINGNPTNPRATVAHNIGDSFSMPSGTITC